MVDFETHPSRYVHWKLQVEGAVARLLMNVDPEKPFRPGYKLKLNSYDLGVDIELADAVQRLRFEHPAVKAVIVSSANSKIFCAGANINMLVLSSHPFKVNFCKYTNETRCAMEDAAAHSGQAYIAAINGTASGGGYELASACSEIYLLDDGNSAASLPEIPLLGVLPGTGGLTRLVDKRKIRRDLADMFSTLAEGVKARRAKEWGLVDGAFPRSRFDQEITRRAEEIAARPSSRDNARGITLEPLSPTIRASGAPAGEPGDGRPNGGAGIESSGLGSAGIASSAPGGPGAASGASQAGAGGAGAGAAASLPGVASLGAAGHAAPDAGGERTAAAAGPLRFSVFEYRYVTLRWDRSARMAELTVSAPDGPQPQSVGAIHEAGSSFWALRAFREIDDALCRLRFDAEEIGLVLLRTRPAAPHESRPASQPGPAAPHPRPAEPQVSTPAPGAAAAPAASGSAGARAETSPAETAATATVSAARILEIEQLLAANRSDWLVNEIVLHMARVLRRLDLTAKSLFAIVDGESCCAGSLLELALAADRIYMKNDPAHPPFLTIGPLSAGQLPMPNGLSRLHSRFLAKPAHADTLAQQREPLGPQAAIEAGLVTVAPDELDWDEAIRVATEERLSLSPDALTGMEASLRFGGPETMESKIYGRLSAWQNWIFTRPNATGEHGALRLYGQPERPRFDWRRT